MSTKKINRSRQRREELREAAAERALCRETRTDAQQLQVLDQRLGVALGATKERSRLEDLIEEKESATRRNSRAKGQKNVS